MFDLFSRHPEPGDTVRLTSEIPTGIFSLPTPAGSIGVVTTVSGSRVDIDIDGGIAGGIHTTARTHQCRVIERGTGIERFRSRMQHRNSVRLGALILLALPLIQYLWGWWRAVGSFDGLIEYLPLAALESATDVILLVLDNPIHAALTFALGSLIWWLAFGSKRRH